MTVPHYYDFGADRAHIGADLVRPGAWDAAREVVGPFRLPSSRPAWEQAAERRDLEARAADVARAARILSATSVCSYGVGTGALELQISRLLPDILLTCTDFAPHTVERLRALFSEARIVRHDLSSEPPIEADLQLMHRLDTELPAAEWQRAFARFHQPVLFVPSVVLTPVGALKELARPLVRPRSTRAGWLRNEAALRDLWRSTHDDRTVLVGGSAAFLLTRRRGT